MTILAYNVPKGTTDVTDAGLWDIDEEDEKWFLDFVNGAKKEIDLFDVETKYAEDQARDSWGRFSFGENADMSPVAMARETLVSGGLTFSVTSHRQPTRGYAISPYPQHSKAVDITSIPVKQQRGVLAGAIIAYKEANKETLSKPGHFLGTWNDNGKVFIDISIVSPSRSDAMKLAREHDQIAIFNLATLEEIVVDRNARSGGA